jgi:hypothetical protein
MPERAAHVAKTIAAGLMFLAVLMLSGGQIPFEASGDAFHAMPTRPASSRMRARDRPARPARTIATTMDMAWPAASPVAW